LPGFFSIPRRASSVEDGPAGIRTVARAARGGAANWRGFTSYEHTAETLNLDDRDRFDTTLQHASESHLALVKPEAPLANSPTGTVQETADREPVRQLPFRQENQRILV